MPLKLESIARMKCARQDLEILLPNLVRERVHSELLHLRLQLRSHMPYTSLRRHNLHARESVQEAFEVERVVAVAVRDVDCFQAPGA